MWLSFGVLASLSWGGERVPEYANDLGPETIDVSSYPPEMQESYKLLQAKCVRCHGAARAINSELTDAKDWARYIKRMQMRPPCCNVCPVISLSDAKAIWRFLSYDSQVRKTGPNALSWEKHRLSLLQAYREKFPEKYQERYGQAANHRKEPL